MQKLQVLFCLLFTGSLFWTRRGEILREARSDMTFKCSQKAIPGKMCMIRMTCLELARLDYGEEKYNSTSYLLYILTCNGFICSLWIS